jgi:hypothetical protein
MPQQMKKKRVKSSARTRSTLCSAERAALIQQGMELREVNAEGSADLAFFFARTRADLPLRLAGVQLHLLDSISVSDRRLGSLISTSLVPNVPCSHHRLIVNGIFPLNRSSAEVCS